MSGANSHVLLGRKAVSRVLSRVSAALSQLIQPIASSEKNTLQKPFERFAVQEHRNRRKGERQENQPEAQPEPEGGPNEHAARRDASDDIVPLRPNLNPQGQSWMARMSPSHQRAQLGSSLPLLNLLISLREKRQFLLRIGRRVYEKIRREQGRGRLRKGAILDQRA